MYKVSVIIPVYNAEEYLERCLNSVINQTLKDIEIICVNDCSKDKSLEILNTYAAKDPRIKVIDCKVNGGESVARNIGIDNATGEYLAFVDNDDIVDLDFYEKLYTLAKTNNAEIAKGEAKEIDYQGKVTLRSENKRIRQNNCKAYFTDDWWTAIYKHELILQNNIRLPQGRSLGGDILFLNRAVLSANTVITIDNIYYTHIMREDSGNAKFLPLEKIISAMDIIKEIISNINEHDIINKISPQGYDYIYKKHMILAYGLSFKIKDKKGKDYCAKTIIEIYNSNNRKNVLDKNLYQENYEILIHFLHQNNAQALSEFLMKNSDFSRLRINILREKVKQNLRRTND